MILLKTLVFTDTTKKIKRINLLEFTVQTILLKLTERTGLRASAGRTDLL